VKQNAEAALKRYLDVYYDDRVLQPAFRVIDRNVRDAQSPWYLWLTVFAAALAGAGTAGGLWTARRAVRARASGAEEVERLGTNVIVEIPPAGHGIRRIKRMLGMVDLYTHDRPASDTSERFKHLRTMLSRALPDGPAALCVTSSIPGEGKTFCAINTAIAFAAAGMRTIIVDCDLRKARATDIFDLAGARGLGNILFEHDSPAGLCRPTHIPSLSVLPVGTVDQIYSIDPDRFAMLLGDLKGAFDRIVVDLPPLTVSSDPLLAAKVADGTILVARKDYVPLHILRESLARLQKPGITFLGTVLNWSGLVSGYFLE
jgi:capsular exopolysaccharide synthesis family protein